MARAPAKKPMVDGAQRPEAPGPSVFISYRRRENALHAALLEASLSALLGQGVVFRDAMTLTPGEAFPAGIENAVRGAAVVLVLIGKGWLEASDEKSGSGGSTRSTTSFAARSSWRSNGSARSCRFWWTERRCPRPRICLGPSRRYPRPRR
jgi:hypothetical protein